MCFSYELCALRLCGDVEEWLINGFAKEEERCHELVETLSRQCRPQGAVVPHYLCSTSHLVPQVHDLDSQVLSMSQLYSFIFSSFYA
jgi:hypothetical protein